MNAADVIAARLAAAGCRLAFGIPGGEVLALVDALERAGIRFVLTKHENAAGFMAEGAWHATGHATGAPGVLVATVGPGIANAFNVVENARQDRVPLIVLAGSVDAAEALSYNHQVFDHGAVFARVCKASFTAADGAVDVMIDKAIGLALSGRPGPVHIDLPIGLADRDQPAPRAWRHGPPLPAAPAPGEALDRARAMFAAAERPGDDGWPRRAERAGRCAGRARLCREAGRAAADQLQGQGGAARGPPAVARRAWAQPPRRSDCPAGLRGRRLHHRRRL